jgi:hypothetical protein
LTSEIDRQYGVFVPVGRDNLNVDARLGAPVYQLANEVGCHPYNLAVAVDDVYERYEQTYKPQLFAELAARKATGLTTKRIELWEDSGYDHSRYPGLDIKARELAAEVPELGWPRAEVDGCDDTDHAALLWDHCEPTEKLQPKWRPRHSRGSRGTG